MWNTRSSYTQYTLPVMYNNHNIYNTMSHNVTQCQSWLCDWSLTSPCGAGSTTLRRCTSAPWSRSKDLCSDLLAVGWDTGPGRRGAMGRERGEEGEGGVEKEEDTYMLPYTSTMQTHHLLADFKVSVSELEMMEARTYRSWASGKLYFSSTFSGECILLPPTFPPPDLPLYMTLCAPSQWETLPTLYHVCVSSTSLVPSLGCFSPWWEMVWWMKLNFLGLFPKVVKTNEIVRSVITLKHFPYNSNIYFCISGRVPVCTKLIEHCLFTLSQKACAIAQEIWLGSLDVVSGDETTAPPSVLHLSPYTKVIDMMPLCPCVSSAREKPTILPAVCLIPWASHSFEVFCCCAGGVGCFVAHWFSFSFSGGAVAIINLEGSEWLLIILHTHTWGEESKEGERGIDL